MLWNEEEWKWEDPEKADMQIDEVPDYVATPNHEKIIIIMILCTVLCWLGKREKDLLRSRGSYLHELLVNDKVPIQEILKRYNISHQVLHDIKNERKYSMRTSKMELFELNNWQVLNNLVRALNNWMERQEYPFSIKDIKHYLEKDLQIVITSKQLYDVVKNEWGYSFK